MEKILISSCLLGLPVRYDGKSQAILHPQINLWRNENRFVMFCPEVAGGLATPRPSAEIRRGRVVTCTNKDVTKEFKTGAAKALGLCNEHAIRFALLKESSPSCGRNTIYDGSHSGIKIQGMGLTAKLLMENQIRVFSENQIPALIKVLAI
ncbi:DUF523 domain-containing protein [Pseudoalteromonas aliena]|uniref:DUF523 domain-containing protein n=1 Tax=Pseudoalteromonas aliena TaxID=247523 RepID=UPI00311FB640